MMLVLLLLFFSCCADAVPVVFTVVRCAVGAVLRCIVIFCVGFDLALVSAPGGGGGGGWGRAEACC